MNRLHHNIITCLLAIIVSIICAIPASAQLTVSKPENGGPKTTFNGDHQFGDIYASLIYSVSGDVESADGVDLSYDRITKYPASEDRYQTYGRLKAPSSVDKSNKPGSPASEFVAYARTMYEYGWFVPTPKGDGSIINTIMRFFSDESKSTSDILAKRVLEGAILGGMMYDIASKLLDVFAVFVSSFDITRIVNVSAPSLDNNTFVNALISSITDALGLNYKNIDIIRSVAIVVLIFGFILAIYFTLSEINKENALSKVKRRGARILVVFIAIPLAMSVSSIFNNIAKYQTNAFSTLPSEINNTYIIDTLDWAVYGNLSPSYIRPGNLVLNQKGQITETLRPTREHVANVQRSINAAKKACGTTIPKYSSTHAIELFLTGQTATVQDYFSGLSATNHSNCTRGMFSEASFYKFTNGTKTFSKKYAPSKNARTPFFFSKNDQLTKSQGQQGQQGASQTSDSSQDRKVTIGVNNAKFKWTPDSPIIPIPFNAKDPQSYLYGATPPENLNDSTLRFANYIHDARLSDQLVNPTTGAKIEDSDTSKEAKAIRTNSLQIAINNRYRGLGKNRMSDQSTAFFLQSKPSGDGGINYKGYNTAPNKRGESKNTGRYGNSFIRYTMPSLSLVDFYSRAGALSAAWMVTGLLGIATTLILLRAPLFGSLIKSITNFLSTVITGNMFSLMRYIAYYAAFRSSLLLAPFGLSVALLLNKYLFADNSFISSIFFNTTLSQAPSLLSPFAWFETASPNVVKASTVSHIGTLLPIIFISMLIASVFIWPTLQVGSESGKIRKISILGALVTFPFILCNRFVEYVDDLERKYRGDKAEVHAKGKISGLTGGLLSSRSRSNKKLAKERNAQIKQERLENQSPAIKLAKSTAKTAATGAAIATGYGAIAAATGAGAAAGGAALAAPIKNRMLKMGVQQVGQSTIEGLSKNGAISNIGKSIAGQAKGLSDVIKDKTKTMKDGQEVEGVDLFKALDAAIKRRDFTAQRDRIMAERYGEQIEQMGLNDYLDLDNGKSRFSSDLNTNSNERDTIVNANVQSPSIEPPQHLSNHTQLPADQQHIQSLPDTQHIDEQHIIMDGRDSDDILQDRINETVSAAQMQAQELSADSLTVDGDIIQRGDIQQKRDQQMDALIDSLTVTTQETDIIADRANVEREADIVIQDADADIHALHAAKESLDQPSLTMVDSQEPIDVTVTVDQQQLPTEGKQESKDPITSFFEAKQQQPQEAILRDDQIQQILGHTVEKPSDPTITTPIDTQSIDQKDHSIHTTTVTNESNTVIVTNDVLPKHASPKNYDKYVDRLMNTHPKHSESHILDTRQLNKDDNPFDNKS